MSEPHRIPVAEADAGERLDVLVARRSDVSRTQAATLIATGQVTVDDRTERASFRVEAGSVVTVRVPERTAREVLGEDIPLQIIHEDEDLLVVDKAAGMVVHPAPGNWTGTLVNALKGRGTTLAATTSDDRAGLVHRLDKETSGLLLVAKSERAHRVLAKALAERRIQRRYVALSWGHLTEDRLTVDRPIGRDPNDRTKMAIVEGGRAAKTDFLRLARFASCDLLRAHLHTGRTHQIRVHLASVGHPVVGDDTYGGGGARRTVGLPPKRHFLHAASIVFTHPGTQERMAFRSPLPPELLHSLRTVAEDPDLIAQADPLEYLAFYGSDG